MNITDVGILFELVFDKTLNPAIFVMDHGLDSMRIIFCEGGAMQIDYWIDIYNPYCQPDAQTWRVPTFAAAIKLLDKLGVG